MREYTDQNNSEYWHFSHSVILYYFHQHYFLFSTFFYSDPFNLTHFSPMSHFYTPWKHRETEKRNWFYEKNLVLVLLGQKSYKQTFPILWIFHIFSIFRIKLKQHEVLKLKITLFKDFGQKVAKMNSAFKAWYPLDV